MIQPVPIDRLDTLKAGLARSLDGLDALETFIVSAVAKVAPWLAPLPTAYLVAVKTMEHLAWPWPVAVIAGAVIEALGLVVTLTALELYGYNRTRRKSDPAAPLTIPIVLVALYLVAAELLTVGLDIAPKLARQAVVTLADWAPAVFPVLSLAGMAILAVRVDHRQRLAEIATERAERALERKGKRAEREAATPERAPAPLERPILAFRCDAPGCARSFATQNALNAHLRTHANGHKRPASDLAAISEAIASHGGAQ